MPERTAIESLLAHVIETLPDSLSKRREVLTGMVQLCDRFRTAGHNGDAELIQKMRELLAFLDEHEIAQRELAIRLKQ